MDSLTITELPPEVLHKILTFLDVPSLLQVSRTSHVLRVLSLDPLLQRARLLQARYDLNFLLENRIPKASISPPNAWIWLSKTNVLSRSISKSLIRIRLNHSLGRRPGVEDLVARAILPVCCSQKRTGAVSSAIVSQQEAVRKTRLKNKLGRLLKHRPSVDRVVEMNIMPIECASGSTVSPKLVETRRKVIKESLKDGLRAWVKQRAIEEQKRKEEEYDSCVDGISVKAVVRKFSAQRAAAELEARTDRVSVQKKQAQARWGRKFELERQKEERRITALGTCSQPTRARVLDLKRFWEGVIKVAAG